MEKLREIYVQKAVSQIPRLLGNQDRNPFSPTYGCFHRDYWLDKTSDFPDAVRQFGVHSLALVYKNDFPRSVYKGKTKIRDWAIAGMEFWAGIQHKDGSFDEFYPYERGWVGPSAFTTFTVVEAFDLLKDEIHADTAIRIQDAIRQAASFIAKGESEEDHLANHHAMACLAVWKAYKLLKDKALARAYKRLWQGFLKYHNSDEGWSREYDGVDPGYLSATVSFLGKIYQTNPDPEILEVVRQSVEFCSYFVYPNGFYAGSMGSRNTLHFYPHGFEIFAKEIPLAASIAEKMLKGLSEGKLVPPEIISDRYVFYRVPEYLQAYLDYAPRGKDLPPLPYEAASLNKYFPHSKIWVMKTQQKYCIANLAKGGVVKVFDCETSNLVMNDCGIIGELDDGNIITSQWIDPSYECKKTETGWEVSGSMNIVPSNKLFNPLKNVIFRTVLLLLGWHPTFAHMLKGKIRKMLMLGNRPVPVHFKRKLSVSLDSIALTSEVQLQGNEKFNRLFFGDEFFVRYVPQSRYFQAQELDVSGEMLEYAALEQLNKSGRIAKERMIRL